MLRERYSTWTSGEVLKSEQVGDIWYFNTRPELNTPHFLNGGGSPLVGQAVKGVLEQYDVGKTVFHPITLMNPEETQLVTREPYFFLNVCNKRAIGNYEALGPEGDYRAPLNCRAGGLVYLPRAGQEDQLVIAPGAIGGPDIWLDPKVPGLLFLSDHLASGLKQAGLDASWRLVRCAVGVL